VRKLSTGKAGPGGTCLSSQLQREVSNGRITVQADLDKKQDCISKIITTKRVGGIEQAVEHLPSKYEALSSKPQVCQKKKVKMLHFTL
jgi:hypothetical protein